MKLANVESVLRKSPFAVLGNLIAGRMKQIRIGEPLAEAEPVAQTMVAASCEKSLSI